VCLSLLCLTLHVNCPPIYAFGEALCVDRSFSCRPCCRSTRRNIPHTPAPALDPQVGASCSDAETFGAPAACHTFRYSSHATP
jgi:hypothetical protein